MTTALKFRNIAASPDDPVETWPFEGILAAVERGTLPDWRRLATAIRAAPWGPVAQQVLEAVRLSRPYGTSELLTEVVGRARKLAADSEREMVATEVRDLVSRSGMPAHSVVITGDALPEPDTLVLKTKAPNLKQSGQWTVPQRITAETTAGFITIDFTKASCAHREVAVEAVTRSGWIRLLLPDGWAARISPSSTNTSHISNKAPETAAPGAPTVIVTGHPLSGYIKIRQRHRKR